MSKREDHPHDHDPDYLPIASTLQRLCDQPSACSRSK
jgi:hypothetical protein